MLNSNSRNLTSLQDLIKLEKVTLPKFKRKYTTKLLISDHKNFNVESYILLCNGMSISSDFEITETLRIWKSNSPCKLLCVFIESMWIRV